MTATATKPRPSRHDRKVAKERKAEAADIKAQIAARVAPPKEKVNPNAPTRKPYKEGSPGFNRAKLGVTLTQIRKSINEPNSVVTVILDEAGNPTGEQSTVAVKPCASLKRLRRASFEARGLLGPLASNSDRRKTRRRNRRYAAANSKGSKPSKKERKAAPVEKAAKK